MDSDIISKRMLSVLLKAFENEGIQTSEEWILFGTPPGPTFINQENLEISTEVNLGLSSTVTISIENNNHSPYIEWGDSIVGTPISAFDISEDKSEFVALLINDTWEVTNSLRLDNSTLLSIRPRIDQTLLRKSALIPIQSVSTALKIRNIIKRDGL